MDERLVVEKFSSGWMTGVSAGWLEGGGGGGVGGGGIWRTGVWPTPWTQSLIITLPKKGNLQLSQNYRPISLISHPSKVVLKILLSRLQQQAEQIIKAEQAGFRAGRSTTEQLFSLRILCEKCLQHQQNIYYAFVDSKKAFDRIRLAFLWATMRLHNVNDNLIRTIECL